MISASGVEAHFESGNDVDMNCLCHSPESWKGPTSAIFTDLITLEFYDGTITAICRCARCHSPKLLSILSWQHSHPSIRVFGVANITEEKFQKLKDLFHTTSNSTEAEELHFTNIHENPLAQPLQTARPIYAVLASRYLEKEIVIAALLQENDLIFPIFPDNVPFDDTAQWLTFFGITELPAD